ncbi:hypothetical protein [Pseudomonas sp. Irchel 3E13]|jgi:hypothetical protein|uniref:hypothetical protein n=1 Tax=Pseudomonas sp. Irchel 3E13 TaxID=2008975 RepID=UPI001179F033|nr:hypothetical protein [Pseudomonas sp. Irchel 3E13]
MQYGLVKFAETREAGTRVSELSLNPVGKPNNLLQAFGFPKLKPSSNPAKKPSEGQFREEQPTLENPLNLFSPLRSKHGAARSHALFN